MHLESLLPPQGILCIKIDALLLCCITVRLSSECKNYKINALVLQPRAITNHAYLFNLMLNSYVQLGCNMKVSEADVNC